MKKLYYYQKLLIAGGFIIAMGTVCKLLTLFINNKILDIIFGVSIILLSILLGSSYFLKLKEMPGINNNFNLKKVPKYIQVLFTLTLIIAIVVFILTTYFILSYYSLG